jgi:dihydroorotate dehydrogenase
VSEARGAASRRVPVLVKIAPDLDDAALAAIVEAAASAGIDGIIVANTTVARDGLTDERGAREAGGLSGRPLFRRSTIVLAKVRKLAGGRLVLVGLGGVDSADTAWSKMAAGADLLQLYTGMIYEGPGLPARILAGLAARLDREGIASIAEVVGSETDRWAGLAT